MLEHLAHKHPFAHSLSAGETEAINWLASRELHRRQQPPFVGAEPPLAELLRGGVAVMNWHICRREGQRVFERIVIRDREDGQPDRYHVIRLPARIIVPMYDIYEDRAATGVATKPEDLHKVWPPEPR